MKKNTSLFIAVRYLWGRAREGGRYLRGAAAGIAVSLIPIVVTLIVADGMIRGIMDRYLELGTGHLQVYNVLGSSGTKSAEEMIKNIMEVEGVRGVWQEQRGMGVLAGRTGRTGVTLRAVDPSFWDYSSGTEFLKIIDGSAKPQSERDIVLGESLALEIGVGMGDTVRLMALRNNESGRMSPRTAAFTVSGVVSCGYNELDRIWCITSIEGGNRILTDTSSESYIIKIDDPYKNAIDIRLKINEKLGSGYNSYTWMDFLRSQHSSYETTRQLLLFIMALIVIVAAVNVSSATSMLALERQRDIAVLKVSGSNVTGIRDIFIFAGFLTGLCGAVIGISVGLLIGININLLIRSLEKLLSFFSLLFNGSEVKILDPGFYLETIPIIVDWGAVLLIGLFTIICSVLASWLPAHKAGKLKPMELLRKT